MKTSNILGAKSLRHSACSPALVLILCAAALAADGESASRDADQAPDSSQGRDRSGPASKPYDYTAYPLLQLLTWPLEKVLAPAVKGAIYPLNPPLHYFLNENVIDRTINLISFGDDDRIMLYPTLNLAQGTSSHTGLSLRQNALFGRPDQKMVAMGNLYVNGDWKFRAYQTSSDILGAGFDSKVSMSLVRVKNSSVNQPGTNAFWFFADTSNHLSVSLSRQVIEKISLRGTFGFRDNNYGSAPPQEDTLISGFFRNAEGDFDPQSRGLDKDWQDRVLSIGITRDTRNNEHIVLAGSDFNFDYQYHLTTAHHDFHGWQAVYTKFFKLGKEKYEISRAEERESGGMDIQEMLRKIDLDNLRKSLLSRKVLALHMYAAQSYELPGNRMPVYGLQTLGNGTPMRGYMGSRFRDYSVFSVSAEYRFPVMRLVDGVIFDEYGIYGRSWDKIDVFDNLKNSWGFGIRVRRPDIYLFRLQAGFHGTKGIQVNLSVDEPF